MAEPTGTEEKKKMSPSRLAAENAYRKRQGLPPVDEYGAELTGEAPAAPTPAAPPPPAPVAASPLPPPPEGAKKLSPSRLASENAWRRKQAMPLIDEYGRELPPGVEPAPADKAAPAAPAATSSAAAATTPAPSEAQKGAATPAPPRPAITPTTPDRNPYVGRAVGTSKAAAAAGIAAVGPADGEINRGRRRLAWGIIAAFLTTWLIAFFRFFLPRTIFEPKTRFTIGYPGDYALGVDTKYQQLYRIWVDRTPDRMFVIYARCTHLGCTPDWKPGENKFKCPCHGSGFDSEGINFEGPAPRPLDRAHVELDAQGQIVVDTSRLYKWPKGADSEFEKPGAYLPV